jgi:hypothetical protein
MNGETGTWYFDAHDAAWFIDETGDETYPSSYQHQLSLETAVKRDLLDAADPAEGGVMALSFTELKELAEEESATKAVDVASYEQWPWEPAYRDQEFDTQAGAENDDA